MNKRMKVMIAYDGSDCADTAIDDLRRAGLPSRGEALIALVADISKTAIANSDELGVLGKYISTRLLQETIALTERETARVLSEAKKALLRGGRQVLGNLPGWRVSGLTAAGNPAEALLQTANEWKPDLIIAGSHGRGAIGRYFLGSVSKKLAENALSPLRIARGGRAQTGDAPLKILIGANTLPDAEKLIRAVGRRTWSGKTEVRLLKLDDGFSAGRISAQYPYAVAILEQSMEILRAGGLQLSVRIQSGELRSALLEEAENWGAGSIFVLAGRGEGSGLSETASSLVTEAACTVEIVR